MLAGWASTPARFREDANAEQDAAGAGYEDRLVVELAQNAADAARAGGVVGRLLFRLEPAGLLVANTGAPLTADGVLALSTLRASGKAAGAVGRFGVGFAAVLAVSDAPQIGSGRAPSVRWSAAETAALVEQISTAQADLAARGGHVPILRLPFAAPPLAVPEGYDTAVWLPYRSPAAAQRARDLLRDLDPTLLLVLDALGEIALDGEGLAHRLLRCSWAGDSALLDGRAWARVTASGPLPAELRAASPADQPGTWWAAAYAPADGAGLPPASPAVLRAPTRTDEPLSLPALVSASVPLEPTRRRVLRGPLASFVLARAGEAVAALAAAIAQPWSLVPTGFAAGDIDAEIRDALAARLPQTPLFAGRLPRDCVVLDLGESAAAATELLADQLAGLLPAAVATAALRPALDVLGVRRLDTAGVVDLLSGLRRPPAFWKDAYAALSRAPDGDALRALPVPLLDGRTVTGPAGALLPTFPLPPEVAALPLRIVDPDAVHPLLERLGARRADASALLAEPAVRDAVAQPDCEPTLVRALVALVAEAGVSVDDEPWLADLPLPAAGTRWVPAADLLWPGGAMARLVDADVGLEMLCQTEWLGHDVAVRLGVQDLPTVLTRYHASLDELAADLADSPDDPLADVDGLEAWARAAAAAGIAAVGDLRVIRDLDLIADLPALVRLIAAEPGLRSAVITPLTAGGARFPSHAAWWLARQPCLDGALPVECALAGDPLLDGLYDLPPADLEPSLLRALGVRTDLASAMADADSLGDLLDRLGDAERAPGRAQVRAVHAAVAAAWATRLDEAPEPPLAVRAVRADGALVVVPTDRAVVLEAPDQLPFAFARGCAVIPAPASAAPVLAELLEVALGSELTLPRPAAGVETPVPALLSELAGAGPMTYRRHDSAELGVPWRYVEGVLHATDAGLPAGLAWAAGSWAHRHLLALAAHRPTELAFAQLETDLED